MTTNGWITFEAMSFLQAGYLNSWALPSSNYPNSVIAPFFMDMNSGATGQVYTTVSGTTPNQQFAIGWRDFARRGADGKLLDERYAFEVILYESSNDVKFQYLNSFGGAYTDGTGAVAGMQGLRELDSTLWGYSLWNKAGPPAPQTGLSPGGRTVTFHYDEADASTYYGASASTELAALAVASVNPAATGYQGTSAASFQLGFTLPVNSNSISASTVLFDDVTAAPQSITLGKVEVSDLATNKRTVTGTYGLLYPAGDTPLQALTLKAGNKYRITAKAGAAGIVGMDDIAFSQDPTQTLSPVCGGSAGTPVDFTSQFLAIPSVREQNGIGGNFRSLAVGTATNMAFMTTTGGNVVAQDIPTLTKAVPTASISVAPADCTGPLGGVATTDGKKVYVACGGTNKVAAILYDNTITPATLTQVDVDGVTPGTQSIALPAIGGNPNAPQPAGVVYAGTRVYVSNGAAGANEPSRDAVYLIDPSANTTGTPIQPVGKKASSFLGAMAVNVPAHLLYVLDVGGSALAVIDYNTNAVVKNVDLPITGPSTCTAPGAIALRPDAARIFIGCGATNRVIVLDATTYAITDTITTTANYTVKGITFTSNGALAYFAEKLNANNGLMGVVNIDKSTYVTTVALSAGPEAIAFISGTTTLPGFALAAESNGWLDSVR